MSKTIEKVDSKIYQKIDFSDIGAVEIAQTLYLIQTEDIDNCATIFDTFNIFIDLVKTSRIKMPDGYKSILYKVADYFTFEQDIAKFLNESAFTREDVINIILWCLGAVISKSKFIR